MSNANEKIEMPEAVESEIRTLVSFLHVMAMSSDHITVASACVNFVSHIIAELPTHAQEGGIEALVKDIRAAIEDRNKDRSSEGL